MSMDLVDTTVTFLQLISTQLINKLVQSALLPWCFAKVALAIAMHTQSIIGTEFMLSVMSTLSPSCVASAMQGRYPPCNINSPTPKGCNAIS